MNITIDKNVLLKAVNNVMVSIDPRVVIPVLSGLKIEAEKKRITLQGGNSDTFIHLNIPLEDDKNTLVDIKATGSIVLPAKLFGEIIKKLPDDKVTVEIVDGFLTSIRSGKAEYKINGVDPAEYPRFPKIEKENNIKIFKSQLKDIIKDTVFAVSTSESRPILTGVNFDFKNDQLICSSTDSFRLSQKKSSIIGDFEGNIVIPGTSLQKLNKLLEDLDEYVDMIITQNQVIFKTEEMFFYSRLLEGNYPDTSRLIPTESKTAINVNTDELLHAIDRAALLAKDDKNNVVKIDIKDDLMQISSYSAEIGTVSEELSVNSLEGENKLKISFSAQFMKEALKVIPTDQVEIHFNGSMRPFIIKPTDDNTILQLVLPVRTI